MSKLPEVFDYSNGSNNPYLVETRHHLIPPCIHCGKFVPVKLDGSDYYKFFMQGAKLQEVFTYLSAQQRELILTGTHPECWEALFKDEEDAPWGNPEDPTTWE